MRILLLAKHFNAGGITSYLITLARGLQKSGHAVLIVTSGGGLVEEVECSGIRHIVLPGARLRSGFDLRVIPSCFTLARIVREEKIDILHAQTRVTALVSAMVSRLTRVPYVTTCHGFFNPHPGRKILGLWGRRTIAVSAPVRDHLIKDLAVPPRRITVVPNGIDSQRFCPATREQRTLLRQEYGLKDEPAIGLIARLSEVKGHTYLIDAMVLIHAEFPSVKCLFFGQGSLEQGLKDQVAARNLRGSVCFYPVVNRAAELLGLFDLCVAPSLSEGLGLSVMEAQSAGLPVVASAVGGVLDIVQDGVTGLMVPPRDPQALAAAIRKILSDPSRAHRMGERARAFIAAHFSIDQMVAGTLRVYHAAIARDEGGGERI